MLRRSLIVGELRHPYTHQKRYREKAESLLFSLCAGVFVEEIYNTFWEGERRYVLCTVIIALIVFVLVILDVFFFHSVLFFC